MTQDDELKQLREKVEHLTREKVALEEKGMPLYDKESAARIQKIDTALEKLNLRLDGYEKVFAEKGEQIKGHPMLGIFGNLFGS